MSRTAARVAAERRGRTAERAAAALLLIKGYRIVARRFRSPAGEEDLLVRRGRILAAVEVKARADADGAAYALGGAQRARIARGLEHFIAANPRYAACNLRFDAVLVAPERWPRHITDAWRID